MNRLLYELRCKCKEEFSITKKRKSSARSEGKPLQYTDLNEITSKTFQIKYDDKVSSVAKSLFCLLYTSPSPRDQRGSRMPSSA